MTRWPRLCHPIRAPRTLLFTPKHLNANFTVFPSQVWLLLCIAHIPKESILEHRTTLRSGGVWTRHQAYHDTEKPLLSVSYCLSVAQSSSLCYALPNGSARIASLHSSDRWKMMPILIDIFKSIRVAQRSAIQECTCLQSVATTFFELGDLEKWSILSMCEFPAIPQHTHTRHPTHVLSTK